MLSNWHTREPVRRHMLLDSEEFSLPQRWAGEELRYLHGAATRRETEAVQLVASGKDAAS